MSLRLSPPLLAAAAAVLLALGFWLGRATDPPGDTAPPDGADAPVTPAATDAVAALSAPEPAAPQNDAAAGLQALERQPASDQREDERARLLVALARTGPHAALVAAEDQLDADRRAATIAEILTEWSRSDPAGAWAWAVNRGPAESHHANLVLTEVAKHDPAQALSFATALAHERPGSAVEIGLSALEGLGYAGNFAAAQQLVSTLALASREDRALLLNFLASQWARVDPRQAAAWAATLPDGPERENALLGVSDAWSDDDAPAAAAFAAQLPPGPARQNALRQAMSKWAMTDPAHASEWLLQFEPGPDMDHAIAAVATLPEVVERNTRLAIDWAGSIADPDLRVTSLAEVVAHWQARDPEGAAAYLDSSPELTPEVRAELQRRLNPGP